MDHLYSKLCFSNAADTFEKNSSGSLQKNFQQSTFPIGFQVKLLSSSFQTYQKLSWLYNTLIQYRCKNVLWFLYANFLMCLSLSYWQLKWLLHFVAFRSNATAIYNVVWNRPKTLFFMIYLLLLSGKVSKFVWPRMLPFFTVSYLWRVCFLLLLLIDYK